MGMVTEWLGALAAIEAAGLGLDGCVAAMVAGEHSHGGGGNGAEVGKEEVAAGAIG